MTVTKSSLVLFVGVVLCILGAFGVQFGTANTFQLGVGIAFASGLVG